MYDKEGNKIQIGDYITTRSRDFGEYGFRKVAMIVDINHAAFVPDNIALLFGGDKYPLIYTLSPNTIMKTEPTKEQAQEIEKAKKIFLSMQEDLKSA